MRSQNPMYWTITRIRGLWGVKQKLNLTLNRGNLSLCLSTPHLSLKARLAKHLIVIPPLHSPKG